MGSVPDESAAESQTGVPDQVSELSFRLLVESVKDYAIFMLDSQGIIRSWNAGAERAKGYRAEEIIGKHLSVFYTPEDRAAGRPRMILDQAVRDGRVEDEGWRVRKDGTRFWADVLITALRTPDGRLQGFAKVTRDLTEKRQLVTARDEAVRASSAKSAFLANMSHELRTPLNAIIGYTEMVMDELRTSGQRDLADDVEKIRFSSRHLLSIISDVLDLSRIEAGRLELRPELINVEQILEEVADTVRPLAERNGNRIEIDVLPECSVYADPLRLRQVLYNIFSNACKFTQNGSICAAVAGMQPDGRQVLISVRDTGIGIEPQVLDRIFERFYQVERDNGQRSTGGTGLGLAISQLLCEAMGGEIRGKSTPGVGSTFDVLLPASSPSRA